MIKILHVIHSLLSVRGSGSSQDIASMSGVAGKLTSQIKHGAQTLGTRTNTGALLGVDRDQWGSEVNTFL